MRQFTENDLRRAERHVRDTDRHISRQKALVLHLEAIDPAAAQPAKEELARLEKRFAVAKETLRRQLVAAKR